MKVEQEIQDKSVDEVKDLVQESLEEDKIEQHKNSSEIKFQKINSLTLKCKVECFELLEKEEFTPNEYWFPSESLKEHLRPEGKKY